MGGSSSPTTAESTPSSPSTTPETSSSFSEDPAQSTSTIVTSTSTRFESTESDTSSAGPMGTSSAGPMSTSSAGPISSTETSAASSISTTQGDSGSSSSTTASQIEALVEAINAGENAIAAMQAALAVLNQLLEQLQLGQGRAKTYSSVSCQHLVQTAAQMVSALPEDPVKVLALADALVEISEGLNLKSNPTCSADQISYLLTQRDWFESQLDLN